MVAVVILEVKSEPKVIVSFSNVLRIEEKLFLKNNKHLFAETEGNSVLC